MASQFTTAVSSYFIWCRSSYKLAAEFSTLPNNDCGVHKPCPLLREETVPAVGVFHFPCCSQTNERGIGLGTRLRVCMHTKLENGVLHNEQQPQSVVNGFIDQGEFEAVKTLSGWEAARCDEHPFRAKMKVSA